MNNDATGRHQQRLVCRDFKGLLSRALKRADAVAEVVSISSLDGGPAPQVIFANNELALFGDAGAPCLVMEDHSGGTLAHTLRIVGITQRAARQEDKDRDAREVNGRSRDDK